MIIYLISQKDWNSVSNSNFTVHLYYGGYSKHRKSCKWCMYRHTDRHRHRNTDTHTHRHTHTHTRAQWGTCDMDIPWGIKYRQMAGVLVSVRNRTHSELAAEVECAQSCPPRTWSHRYYIWSNCHYPPGTVSQIYPENMGVIINCCQPVTNTPVPYRAE